MAYIDPKLFKDHSPRCDCDLCEDVRGGRKVLAGWRGMTEEDIAPCVCRYCTNERIQPSQAIATLKRFSLFFALQFANYSLLCWNIRVVAAGWVWQTMLSDLLVSALSFTLIQKVADTHGWVARLGYIAGGVAGSGVSVLVTGMTWGN